MYFNYRLKASIFYIIVIATIIATVVFFTQKSLISLKEKEKALELKKEKIEELNRRKMQLTTKIDRLKNDREYILSYAKTFGYLDTSKNEKIIKIIRDEKSDINIYNNKKEDVEYTDKSSSENYINVKALIAIAILITICFAFYILITRKHQLIKHS